MPWAKADRVRSASSPSSVSKSFSHPLSQGSPLGGLSDIVAHIGCHTCAEAL